MSPYSARLAAARRRRPPPLLRGGPLPSLSYLAAAHRRRPPPLRFHGARPSPSTFSSMASEATRTRTETAARSLTWGRRGPRAPPQPRRRARLAWPRPAVYDKYHVQEDKVHQMGHQAYLRLANPKTSHAYMDDFKYVFPSSILSFETLKWRGTHNHTKTAAVKDDVREATESTIEASKGMKDDELDLGADEPKAALLVERRAIGTGC